MAFCPKCGNKINEGDQFCAKCGNYFGFIAETVCEEIRINEELMI